MNVRLEYRRSNLVYEDILHNSVDFGLVAFPVKMRQIEALPFHNDHLVVITHPLHALVKRAEVEIKDLAGQKFIGFDPDIPTRKAIDQIFRDNKLEIEPVMEFDNIETVKRAVEVDHGIAIVPQATVVQESRQGTLAVLPFKGRSFTRPLAILHRKVPGADAGDEEVRRNAGAGPCLKPATLEKSAGVESPLLHP